MSLGIIIPTYNRSALLEKLLFQILEFKGSVFKYHVIIVNDHSTDHTAEVIKKFINDSSDFRVINTEGNWWWTKCFNTGMVVAFKNLGCDYVLSLNDDVEIYPAFFHELQKVIKILSLKYDSNFIFNCASKNILTNQFHDLGIVKSKNKIFKGKPNVLSDYSANGSYAKVNHNHGRGLLVPHGVFDLIGELNYKVFPQYLGDSDFALRAQKAGVAQFYTTAPYIMSYIELTSKSKFEEQFSFLNLWKKLTDKYSDTHIGTIAAFNRSHYDKLTSYFHTGFEVSRVVGGYLKRWIKK